MRPQLYILTLFFLIFGCKNKNSGKKKNVLDSLIAKESFLSNTQVYTDNIYNSDSVSISVKNDSLNIIILLTIGSQKREYNLSKLNIPAKVPSEI